MGKDEDTVIQEGLISVFIKNEIKYMDISILRSLNLEL